MKYNKYKVNQNTSDGKKHLLVVIALSEEQAKMLAPEDNENQFLVEVTFVCSTEEKECRIVEAQYCV
jgi:hypothetical protein